MLHSAEVHQKADMAFELLDGNKNGSLVFSEIRRQIKLYGPPSWTGASSTNRLLKLQRSAGGSNANIVTKVRWPFSPADSPGDSVVFSGLRLIYCFECAVVLLSFCQTEWRTFVTTSNDPEVSKLVAALTSCAEWRQTIQAVFSIFDVQNRGAVQLSGVVEAIQQYGPTAWLQFHNFQQKFDFLGDIADLQHGKLREEEWMTMCTTRQNATWLRELCSAMLKKHQWMETIDAAYGLCDRDSNGVVAADELFKTIDDSAPKDWLLVPHWHHARDGSLKLSASLEDARRIHADRHKSAPTARGPAAAKLAATAADAQNEHELAFKRESFISIFWGLLPRISHQADLASVQLSKEQWRAGLLPLSEEPWALTLFSAMFAQKQWEEVCSELFDDMDADGSTTLTQEEFETFVNQYGPPNWLQLHHALYFSKFLSPNGGIFHVNAPAIEAESELASTRPDAESTTKSTTKSTGSVKSKVSSQSTASAAASVPVAPELPTLSSEEAFVEKNQWCSALQGAYATTVLSDLFLTMLNRFRWAAVCQQVFECFDENANGSLSRQEVESGIQTFGSAGWLDKYKLDTLWPGVPDSEVFRTASGRTAAQRVDTVVQAAADSMSDADESGDEGASDASGAEASDAESELASESEPESEPESDEDADSTLGADASEAPDSTQARLASYRKSTPASVPAITRQRWLDLLQHASRSSAVRELFESVIECREFIAEATDFFRACSNAKTTSLVAESATGQARDTWTESRSCDVTALAELLPISIVLDVRREAGLQAGQVTENQFLAAVLTHRNNNQLRHIMQTTLRNISFERRIEQLWSVLVTMHRQRASTKGPKATTSPTPNSGAAADASSRSELLQATIKRTALIDLVEEYTPPDWTKTVNLLVQLQTLEDELGSTAVATAPKAKSGGASSSRNAAKGGSVAMVTFPLWSTLLRRHMQEYAWQTGIEAIFSKAVWHDLLKSVWRALQHFISETAAPSDEAEEAEEEGSDAESEPESEPESGADEENSDEEEGDESSAAAGTVTGEQIEDFFINRAPMGFLDSRPFDDWIFPLFRALLPADTSSDDFAELEITEQTWTKALMPHSSLQWLENILSALVTKDAFGQQLRLIGQQLVESVDEKTLEEAFGEDWEDEIEDMELADRLIEQVGWVSMLDEYGPSQHSLDELSDELVASLIDFFDEESGVATYAQFIDEMLELSRDKTVRAIVAGIAAKLASKGQNQTLVRANPKLPADLVAEHNSHLQAASEGQNPFVALEPGMRVRRNPAAWPYGTVNFQHERPTLGTVEGIVSVSGAGISDGAIVLWDNGTKDTYKYGFRPPVRSPTNEFQVRAGQIVQKQYNLGIGCGRVLHGADTD